MAVDELRKLEITAAKCRLNALRMVKASGHGHIGGAFSCMDIVTALYFREMRCNAAEPNDKTRDRFILSAGHKCLAQYAALAEKGYFPKTYLDTYGSLGSHLPGHPDMHKLPGIEANTGALGHGLAIGVGMALGVRLDNLDSRIYVLMGDGELAEGSNWEAVAAAAHHKLSNLCVFVDFNGLQISGRVQGIMNLTPFGPKFESFGWNAVEINGNDMYDIVCALEYARTVTDRPTVIIAHTVKSKGISFAEDKVEYHFWSPGVEEIELAEQSVVDGANLKAEDISYDR